ncbi:MAG TPA: hypothetical protein VK997_06635 [Deferrisomatales bacterium]|nr:hypothetical protein [Deferrisomatales bacterium]
MAKNCWEIKNCCREPGTVPRDGAVPCPAAHSTEFDGVNGGKNGGRICWYVAGTLCGGKQQGSFVDKQITCLACDFYHRVKKEEGTGFRVKPYRLRPRD